jgi:hypothetical protein
MHNVDADSYIDVMYNADFGEFAYGDWMTTEIENNVGVADDESISSAEQRAAYEMVLSTRRRTHFADRLHPLGLHLIRNYPDQVNDRTSCLAICRIFYPSTYPLELLLLGIKIENYDGLETVKFSIRDATGRQLDERCEQPFDVEAMRHIFEHHLLGRRVYTAIVYSTDPVFLRDFLYVYSPSLYLSIIEQYYIIIIL